MDTALEKPRHGISAASDTRKSDCPGSVDSWLGWELCKFVCFFFLFLNLIISVLQELHAFSVADGLNSTYSK